MIIQQIVYIKDSVDELKVMVKGLDERMRAVELSEAGYQAINLTKIESAHNRLDSACAKISDIDNRMNAIERKMPAIDELLSIKNKLFIVVALSGFIGTAVGGLVIATLFNLLFGGG